MGTGDDSIRSQRPDVAIALLGERVKRVAAAQVTLQDAARADLASVRGEMDRRMREFEHALQKERDARAELERNFAVLQNEMKHRERADDTQKVQIAKVEEKVAKGVGKSEIKKAKIETSSSERKAWITAIFSLLTAVATGAFALLQHCGH